MKDTVVFTFGRMNPPTIGHEKLVDKVKEVAGKMNADPHVYLSHTQDKKKNPLEYQAKVKLAQSAFGPTIKRSGHKNIIQILQYLEKQGYKKAVMVVGSDRVADFRKILNTYNGKDFNFDEVSVVSAGERDPDADGLEGMSASKVRALARSGDYNEFAKGMPASLSKAEKKKVYDEIRDKLGVAESIEEALFEEIEISEKDIDLAVAFFTDDDDEYLDEATLNVSQRRKRAMIMKRIAPKIKLAKERSKKKLASADKLMDRSRKAATNLLRKKFAGKIGADYANLSPSQKINVDKVIEKKRGSIEKIAKKMLPKVRKKEQERLKSARSESLDLKFEQYLAEKLENQPAKYHTGLAKSTKEKRASQFAKQAKMDDNNPDAYRPAPGDAGAKTKPSKHTLKYKRMYGEDINEAFDKPYPIKLKTAHKKYSKSRFNRKYYADVTLKDKSVLKIIIEEEFADGEFVLNFTRNGSYALTGGGDSQRIFATVLDFLKQFFAVTKNETIKSIQFFAEKTEDEEDEGRTGSREKLYARLIKRYIPKGFKLKTNTYSDSSSFEIYNSNFDYDERMSLMNEEMLDEAFDKPYPVKLKPNHSRYNRNYYASVKLKDRTTLSVTIQEVWGDGDFILEFRRGGSQMVTGEGDAMRIFATVIEAVKQFFKITENETINFIRFTALKSDDDLSQSQSGSREKLYERLLKRYLPQGFKMNVYRDQFSTSFEIVNPNYDEKARAASMYEAFDSPYPIKLKKTGAGFEASTMLDDGSELYISFEKYGSTSMNQEEKDAYILSFERDASDDVTGEGDAMRIFATVLEAIKQFAQMTKDESISWVEFLAKKPKNLEGSSKKGSREKLYARMLKKFAPRGYEVKAKSYSYGTKYFVQNTNYNPELNQGKPEPKAKGGIGSRLKKFFSREMTEETFSDEKARAASINEAFEQFIEEIEAVKKKSEQTGIPYSILKQVYDRGMAAWKSGHRPGTTPQQWALARINSFATGGKTQKTADKDLWAKVQKESLDESYNPGMGQTYFASDLDIKFEAAFAHHPSVMNQSLADEFKLMKQFDIGLAENIYRPGSDEYFSFFVEARKLFHEGALTNLSEEDKEILRTDIGEFAMYEGKEVPLDCPLVEEEDVELNKPKRGGNKKFYVYVKNPGTGNVKKVEFGDTSGLKVKINDPAARKSFAARHQCSTRNDKTTPSYWACRLPRYAKSLGMQVDNPGAFW